MKTILLYGFLGREFGRVHHYEVQSPAEAIRAMCVTLKGFRKALSDGGAYRLLVGGADALSKDRVGHPVSDRESIRIVPVVAGAGKGIGQILLGVVLIALAYPTGGMSLTAGTAFAAGTTTAATMGYIAGSIGIALVLGGAAQLLFTPKAASNKEKPENTPSYAFDGAVNTISQGNAVPLLYGGPLIIGSQVVSAGLAAEPLKIPDTPTAAKVVPNATEAYALSLRGTQDSVATSPLEDPASNNGSA